MTNFLDLMGQRFGRLVVVERAPNRNGKVWWKCQCDCGNIHYAATQSLRSRHTTSCGCYLREKYNHPDGFVGASNGESNTRLYKEWFAMRRRCKATNGEKYEWYGKHGIKVCEEWERSYLAFKEWALANGYNDSLSLDRIDVNGDYEPSNCRWITMAEQQNNKRGTHYVEYNGQVKTLMDWAREYNLDGEKLRSRVRAGWTDGEEILFGRPARKTTRSNNVCITYNGKTQCVAHWAKELGVGKAAIHARIYRGWTDPHEVLFGRRKKGVVYGN